jgi:ferredoxin-type protein NapG
MSAKTAKPPKAVDRRRFLQDAARGMAGCAVDGMGLALFITDARALPAQALRPPGALGKDDFLAASIRCGPCVRDCPYNTLVLAQLGEDGPATGTPFSPPAISPARCARIFPASSPARRGRWITL